MRAESLSTGDNQGATAPPFGVAQMTLSFPVFDLITLAGACGVSFLIGLAIGHAFPVLRKSNKASRK